MKSYGPANRRLSNLYRVHRADVDLTTAEAASERLREDDQISLR